MKNISRFQVLNILFTLLVLTVNGLSNALPLNGKGTGEIADQFDIFFVPAGYVFSIWGVIYLGLLVFTVFQGLKAQRENEVLRQISPWYWASCAANSIWIFLWHYEIFPATLVVMIALLISLIVIYLKLSRSELSKAERFYIKLPFSIYLGWVSVATIANTSQVLFFVNWRGWGISSPAWAAVMLGVASVLGLLMLVLEQDFAYNFVLIWAFIGIAMKHNEVSLIFNTALIASALLVIGMIAAGTVLLRRKT